MIKRMNKVTSLLVAAAAVASIVPATGVNAADYKRVESKDGTVYSVVAFKDGKAIIDGNIKDGDTDAVYFLNNGKLTELEDIDTGSEFALYGDKYVSVDNGDYYIDLETGKVTDEDLESDKKDDAASALRKKIRNTADDRYKDHADLKSDLEEIEGKKFGETWYKTSYSLKNSTTSVAVYTDVKGNYIDADYNVGKVKVTVDVNGVNKNVTLTNTDDEEDYNTSIAVNDAKVIAQDSKYFYRTAKLTVTSDSAIKEINGLAVASKSAFTVSEDGKSVSFNVIQKISKAQASGDVDGAKYAQSVSNYVISDEKGVSESLLADAKFNVIGSKLVSYNYNESAETVVAQTIEFKTSRGFNYVELQDETDAETAIAFDVDAEGNLWRLEKGTIYKFDNNEDWEKVYKVDGAMENLSVYNSKNLVTWNEDDEIYSIVGGKTISDEDKEEVKTGWIQESNGAWSFVKADGTKATGWLNDNGTWYYLDSAGNMQTGWVNVNGTWYYLNPVSNGTKGAMQTGWVYVSGTWYYLQSNGAMKTGWLNDNGTWYYLKSNGAMAANTTIDGYRLGANGAWIR